MGTHETSNPLKTHSGEGVLTIWNSNKLPKNGEGGRRFVFRRDGEGTKRNDNSKLG